MVISALFTQFNQWSFVEQTTKRKCGFAIKKLLAFCDNIPTEQLTSATASRFQVFLKNAGLSDASIASYFAACSQVFAWAVGQGLILSNPFGAVKKIRQTKIEIRTFKLNEIDALLQAVNTITWRDKTARLRWTGILLSGLHGLRLGECLNLRWQDDIDLDCGLLHVQYRADRKNECWGWGSKGKAGRCVPMSQNLWECLSRLEVIAPWRYPLLKEKRCRNLQSRIGSLTEFERKMPALNFYRELRRIKGAAGIKDGGVHRLRKNAATHLAQQGVPWHEAKILLGHSSIKTTLDSYIAVDQQLCIQHGRAAFDNWAR